MSQTCEYMFAWHWGRNRVGVGVLQCGHVNRGQLYKPIGVKNIVSYALGVKILNVHVFTHKHSPVHQVLHIYDLDFCSIIHNSSISHPHASCSIKNTIYLGVLLLTFHIQHFPLSYEGVPKPVIEVVCHVHRMYHRVSQFILGQSDKFVTMFSSYVWFHPCPTWYWHNGNRYIQYNFCVLLALTILLILWILVWFQWFVPSQHVLDYLEHVGRNGRLKSHQNPQNE